MLDRNGITRNRRGINLPAPSPYPPEHCALCPHVFTFKEFWAVNVLGLCLCLDCLHELLAIKGEGEHHRHRYV